MSFNFTAIDFETAIGKRWSICSIGLVRIENGEVTHKINQLICPPGNEYHPKNIEIHGITPDKTKSAPTFNKVWDMLKPFIEGQVVVAHNIEFDSSCLTQVLDYYHLAQPSYQKQCTLKLFGYKLDSLCHRFNIPLNHHDALSDAMACARLYWMWKDRELKRSNGKQ